MRGFRDPPPHRLQDISAHALYSSDGSRRGLGQTMLTLEA
jgi:hypothetical protein